MTDDKNIPKLLTPADVAKILQVGTETVRRYTRSGELKSVRLGGRHLRISSEDLEEFLKNSKC